MDKPAVVFVIGLPGSGKTTLSEKFAKCFGFPLVTTEVVRVHLLSVDRVDEDCDFSPDELAQTYNIMYLMTDSLLAGGSGVILDGVFRTKEQRQRIFDIAEKHGAPVLGFEVTCKESVLLERIRARKAAGTVSPAGEGAYTKIAGEYEPTDGRFIRVDNSQ
jgi:predicted kinase